MPSLRRVLTRFATLWVACAVLAGGVAVTALAASQVERTTAAEADERFLLETRRMTERIARQLERNHDLLLTLQGLFETTGAADASDFAAFVEPLRLGGGPDSRYPGLDSVGYVEEVTWPRIEDFIVERRREHPGYTVRPHVRNQTSALVTYVEPAARRTALLGFNARSRPPAAAAMSRALRVGGPQMSAPLSFRTGGQGVTSVVAYSPVTTDRGGQERRGWVFTSVQGQDFLSSALGGVGPVGVSISDSRSDVPIAEAPRRFPASGAGGLERTVGLTVDGRTWVLQFRALPGYGSAAEGRQIRLIWLSGLALTAVVGGLVVTLQRSLGRALGQVSSTTTTMQAAQARHWKVLDNLQEVVFTTDRQGSWTFLNPAWEELTGLSVATSLGTRAGAFLHEADRRRCDEALADLWAGRVQHVRLEVRATLPRGECWIAVRAGLDREPDGTAAGVFGTLEDVTEQRRLEAELAHRADHDPLTGLPNRGLLLGALAHAQRVARGQHLRAAVLFVDLDRFKVYNDSLGHAAGDEVLRIAAQRIQGCVRDTDTVGRLGGDEFLVIMGGVDSAGEAVALAQRLTDALRRSMTLRGYELVLNASIGIALDDGKATPDLLLHWADAAMYEAKRLGKGRWRLHDGHTPLAPGSALEREAALRRAIERNELVLHYQPVRRLRTREVVSVEALVRWPTADGGQGRPESFLPVAEESGLIHELGAWVLDEACRQAARWQKAGAAAGSLPIAVNLSPSQLLDPALPDLVRGALDRYGLPGSKLVIEVTEHALMRDADAAAEVLDRLRRERGVRAAIDDFGTGYSSFSHLRQLPIDALKIDRSFVAGLHAGSTDWAIVSAVVSLAQAFGVDVIAEGVENAEQLAGLAALGCDLVQGYALGHPVPATGVDELLVAPTALAG